MFTSLSKFMEYIKQFNSKWIQCEYCEEVDDSTYYLITYSNATTK